MEENPLDLEVHEEDSLWAVWKRRIMFFVLIALCVTFAAPSFGSCTGAFEGQSGRLLATYKVDGEVRQIRENDLTRIKGRLRSTREFLARNAPRNFQYMLMFPNQNIETADAYLHVLLDQAAQDAGIRLPKGEVGRRLMKDIAQLDRNGAFDAKQYESLVASIGGDIAHVEITRTLQELFRRMEYERLLFGMSGLEMRFGGGTVPTEDAYQEWRKENQRVTAAFVVQPYAPVRKLIESAELTEDDLKNVKKFIGEKAKYRIPPRKQVEMAYVHVKDVTDEQFAKMQEFVYAQGLIEEEPDTSREDQLTATYWPTFYSVFKDNITFTRDQWIANERELMGYDDLQTKYLAAKKAYDDAPDDKKPALPVVPVDPSTKAWEPTARASDVLRKFWLGNVGREVLGGMILQHMAERSEREQKSFEDLAAEFAVLGVQVSINTDSLEDSQLSDKYPAELMKDNEAASVVRSRLRGPSGEATFTPQVHSVPLPATQFEGRVADRGSLVLRLAGFEPSRGKNFKEIRAEATADWRAYQVTKKVKDVLVGIQKATLAEGGPRLDAAAQAAGLTVRRVTEFNGESSRRTPPVVPDEGPLADQLREVADSIRYERFVMDRYGELSRLSPGQFLNIGVLIDPTTEAGYLIQTESMRFPERIEVNEINLGTARQAVAAKVRERVEQVIGFEALKKRFSMDIKPDPDSEGESEDETAKGDK